MTDEEKLKVLCQACGITVQNLPPIISLHTPVKVVMVDRYGEKDAGVAHQVFHFDSAEQALSSLIKHYKP